jgi:hypothetical protein
VAARNAPGATLQDAAVKAAAKARRRLIGRAKTARLGSGEALDVGISDGAAEGFSHHAAPEGTARGWTPPVAVVALAPARTRDDVEISAIEPGGIGVVVSPS